MSQVPPSELSPESDPRRKSRVSLWRRLGAGSLTISLVVHCILILAGVAWVITIIPEEKKADVNFLPEGGGGGTPGSVSKINQQKRATMSPPHPSRIVAQGAASSLTLPESDTAPSFSPLGALSSGGLAGGLGGAGTGGGRGNGQGTGIGNGKGPGLGGTALGTTPFSGMMFGKPVKAKTIGVVLDVSGSMLPHLGRVVEELDRMGSGSPLVLYSGCGIMPGRPEMRSYSTADIDQKRFERFWRLSYDQAYSPPKTLEQGSAKIKVDFSTPLPIEPLYKIFANRPNTYYLDFQGYEFSWSALLARELKDVEAVYWFSDFQDAVDDKEAKDLSWKFRGRKQKLYVQPLIEGASFPKIKEFLVDPTGGEVINVKP